MRTGIRLTCLKNGDPLLGEVWIYKNLTGEEAIQQKLNDLFIHINKLKFTDVIDTIQINKNANNQLYVGNSGINGDLWPMEKRMDTYHQLCGEYNLNLILEIEFPTAVTDLNVNSYAQYAVNVINTYPWVKRWQIMTEPESRDESGVMKCPPYLYVQLIKYIYEIIHTKYNDIQIGGPGICLGVSDYVNSEYIVDGETFHNGWLATATGEYYGVDENDDDIGPSGFLEYIDFFAFQGKQNLDSMNYNIYTDVIERMKKGLVSQAQRNNLIFDVEYLSTYQGHYAESGNYNDLQLQAFRDLREIINAYKANVIPFKTQLVDEFFDPEDVDAVKNVYGLLYYFLGNTTKPAYDQYKFLLTKLEDYTQLADNTYNLNNKRPFVMSDDLHSVMLMNREKTMLCTVIFPAHERQVLTKNPSYTTVTLKPAVNREYYLPDGMHGVLQNPLDITFQQYDFVFVEEAVSLEVHVDESVLKEAQKRMELYSHYAKEIMELISDDYTKDVYDGTNFPKLVHSLAVELGDTEYERQILEDNMYLKTAHGDAIYNNFGAMLKLPWRKDWSEEQYRTVVSALIESLLKGATKSSIEKALKTFTTFDVHIYELFKDYKHYGMTKEMHYENQYSFVVEVEKDLESTIDTEKLYDDIRLVTDIVRPAHTIPIIMVVLVGKEDYGDWYENKYGIPWKDSDVEDWKLLFFEETNKYGWKANNYDLVFNPNKHDLNSAHVIGPKYTLHDIDYVHSFITEDVKYSLQGEDELFHINAFYEENYEREIKENVDFHSLLLMTENKYGIRPYISNTLITNLGKTYGTNNDNNFVTGFMYAITDSDHYESWIKYEEDKYILKNDEVFFHTSFQLNEDKFEPPIDEKSWNSSIFFEEVKFKYRVGPHVLHTFGNNNTHLNTFKTAFQERMDDDYMRFDMQMPFEEEKYVPKNDECIINIPTSIFEDTYVHKTDELTSFETERTFEEEDFKYKFHNHLLRTNLSTTNTYTTSIETKVKESCSIKLFTIDSGVENIIQEVSI